MPGQARARGAPANERVGKDMVEIVDGVGLYIGRIFPADPELAHAPLHYAGDITDLLRNAPVELGWLPASGYVPLTENWRASIASTIMPAFVLGNAIAAILMRHTRSAMLQVLESDYVRTARAKGLSERSVILKHAMRNALTPIITLGALELGTLLSGAVLTEQIFSIPGFGKLIVDAVFNRDYAVVQGVVLTTATIYITLNLIADIAYVLVNPRLRAKP